MLSFITINSSFSLACRKATRFGGTFDEYKAHTAEITQKRVEESVKRMANINN